MNLLLAGKRQGHLGLLKPQLDKLLTLGFRLSHALYDQILINANQ